MRLQSTSEGQPRSTAPARALAYLEELTGSEVDQTQSIEAHSQVVQEALGRLVERRHIPCPALVDDACTIYSHRPIIARKFGIPLWNPRKPGVLQACELNCKDGEAIAADGLVGPQIKLRQRSLALGPGATLFVSPAPADRPGDIPGPLRNSRCYPTGPRLAPALTPVDGSNPSRGKDG